ncbi:MAG TPA: TAT-variant-translocated molybdopterin oxidoreductase [Pyrinomonadaceae bacterium]|nr:TAT-variant-translocated molybdopterin oxidoreductase [Pyrinomonadaceae bacterium]
MPSKDSKTNFALLRDQILAQKEKTGKEYWRSVEEFVDAPEFEDFVKREYPNHADEWDDSLSRRHFIKIMGASLALAGLSGCVIQPPEKIVPRVTSQEDFLPGKPLFLATTMTLGGRGVGVLAECYEGRPIKIEGNPEHPGSLGATDVRAQASLLQLYDPDRSQSVNYRGNLGTWQAFSTELRAVIEQNRADGGAGIRFLTETIVSPTLISQFRQIFQELPNARLYQYQPVNEDNATAGAMMAFGAPVNTVYRFDQAQRVLSLQDDIFSSFNVRYTKDYIQRRKFSEQQTDINRLYMVETTVTITGAKADHRLAVKPSQMIEVSKAIAATLGVTGANPNTAGFTPEMIEWINVMAKDLQAFRGRSIVTAGDEQPPMVHALAHAMNQALGNVGTTVTYTEPLQPNAEQLQVESLRQLIQEIDAGAVRMLVILGANPVYYTPADLKLNAERMNKIPLRIHLGLYSDETAELCHWHIPEKHYLEMWSDTRAYDGTVSIVQPAVQPLYDPSRSVHEVVQLFLRENFDQRDYDIVRSFWQRQTLTGGSPSAVLTAGAKTGATNTTQTQPQTAPNANQQATQQQATTQTNQNVKPTPAASPAAAQTGNTTGGQATTGQNQQAATTAATTNFEDNWRRVVHDGLIPNTASPARTVSANTGFLGQPTIPIANTGGGNVEISILPDPTIYDGRFSNNGWLQELPKPLTKITWDNVALISPRTARDLKLNLPKDHNDYAGGDLPYSFINSKGGNLVSDLVRLNYQGAEILKDVPIWVQPGQPDGVITITLGYGRARAGLIGTGIGYNAYDVRRSDAPYYGTGSITPTGGQMHIASTQIHFNMEGRDLLLAYDVENAAALGNERKKYEEKYAGYDKSMYPQYEYNGYKWGMTIDLNNCVGCNACVIACQAENNIPVVGKEQVERSREMHWLRIDAYYKGDDVNNPEGPYFQPVPCMHCELAPCEPVCPVHATVHSAEGLNDMVYNRCVGTRYCSNNCPYKVRRFNFMLYADWDTPQYKLMRNPEVTIRSRGVMEKCTYCVQRIAAARIEAEKDQRKIRDGEILTACQAVCPADAIVFGDLNDETSQVAQLKRDPRDYKLLNVELNTQPRTSYLAALKNYNKEMPDYRALEARKSEEQKPEGERH